MENTAVTTQRSATASRPSTVPMVSRTGRTAKYPAHMKKKRQKEAMTVAVSRGSTLAARLSRR